MPANPTSPRILERSGLDDLIFALRGEGLTVVGPTVRDGAIVYDELVSARDLPIGWTDRQDAATYRLRERDDEACFGFVVGPHSWKQYLHPPGVRLWSARREMVDGVASFHVDTEPPTDRRYAFLGVRACEIAAMRIQDRVFLGGITEDPIYAQNRQGNFIVAVNCAEAGGTCFCDSMNTGPRAHEGFDLALTELLSADEHVFLLEIGSQRGEKLAGTLPTRPAQPGQVNAARRLSEDARRQMGRTLSADHVPQALARAREHPHWDDVAERCESCANCTMVCPTCFCHTVEDTVDLTGDHAERWRRWDSCFNADFSYINGGHIRSSTRSRYRQWLTHKLSTWHDQFGTSGCVGCGRCITWCPVGIDLTREAEILSRAPDGNAGSDEESTA